MKVKELLLMDKHEAFPVPGYPTNEEITIEPLPERILIKNQTNMPDQVIVTGASKHDQSKADLSLLTPEFLEAVARAFMVGEKKYGRYNYYKGHNASQLVAAAMRHLTAWMSGEENDPVDGQPHLGSVGACVAMIIKQQKLGTLKDNRYKEGL